MHAVYIHIPFCKSICTYCDFCKVLKNPYFVTPYLNSLIKEINEKYDNETIETLYIGGGTPSALDIKDLRYLLEICKIFKLSSNYEFTFECNVNDINDELLSILIEYGVNRLSIGIESFDKNKLEFMGRRHDVKEVEEKIKLVRSHGFGNINLDLIYGIPKESVGTLKKDLKEIIKLNPEHISTYSLIIEDNTVIGNTKMVPIDEDLDYEMYQTIIKILKKNGYVHYEVSNFSKPGFESRHNTNYWKNREYYGFGVGAHGYIGNVRYENTRSIVNYIKGHTVLNQEVLSKKDTMDNEIMLGFRLLKGLNLQEFYDKYEVNIQEVYDLKLLLKDKELIYKDGYLFINPEFIYVMNEILIRII